MSTPDNAIQFPSGTTTTPLSGKLRRRTFKLGTPDDDHDGDNTHADPDDDDNQAVEIPAMNGGAVNGGEEVTATIPRKKRLRGRSLRSNVLLRPRRLSIPTPTTVPLITGEAGGKDSDDEDTDSTDEESDSDDYSDDDEEGVVYCARSGSIAIIAAGRSRQEEDASAQDTVFWGWVVLLSTWAVFVVGMGSVVGVWEWAWGAEPKDWPRSVGGERGFPGEFPISGYYPAMCILTCIMAWVWVVTAWVGMKYFKHAKIQS